MWNHQTGRLFGARALRLARLLPLAVLATTAAKPAGAQPSTAIELRDVAPGELRVEAFRLDRPGTVRIDAVGAEPGALNRLLRIRNSITGFVSRVLDRDPPRFDDAWSATAWIVDAGSREVVWRLDASETRSIDGGLAAFEGELQLPAGTYELYYANFPDVGWRGSDGPGWEYDRNAAARLRFKIEPKDTRLTVLSGSAARDAFEADNAIALGRAGATHDRTAFDLSRDIEVDIYMVGEATRSRSYDYGWIINADTRAMVWSFDWVRSQPAGGTRRNRSARERMVLPAGRYAAFFTRDRSHGPGDWRSLPPGDPLAWGLSVRPVDPADRNAFRTYAYEPVPARDAFVSITRVGNEAATSRGFTLTRDLDVRVFAIGEGRENDMFDYAWIQDAHTRGSVWSMDFAGTRHAGGTTKNRLFDGVVRLPAGSYLVHYVSDDSHAFDDWNGEAPVDAEFWGVTLVSASPEAGRDAIRAYDPDNDPRVIARIVRVGDGRQVRRRFTLDRETDVRVYAIGEGTGETMHDYARIVDGSGREIWRMRYQDTEHAGGARKNRRVNQVVRLAGGEYELIYRTDDSHAWGEWNSTPPQDPSGWGVTLLRER